MNTITRGEQAFIRNTIRNRDTAAFRVLFSDGVVTNESFDDEMLLVVLNHDAFDIIRVVDAAGFEFRFIGFKWLRNNGDLDALPFVRHVTRNEPKELQQSLKLLKRDYGKAVNHFLRLCAEYAMITAEANKAEESKRALQAFSMKPGTRKRHVNSWNLHTNMTHPRGSA